MRKILRELVSRIEREGVRVVNVDPSRPHPQLHIVRSDGEKIMMAVSASPSDHRAVHNNIAVVRRWLKEA